MPTIASAHALTRTYANYYPVEFRESFENPDSQFRLPKVIFALIHVALTPVPLGLGERSQGRVLHPHALVVTLAIIFPLFVAVPIVRSLHTRPVNTRARTAGPNHFSLSYI